MFGDGFFSTHPLSFPRLMEDSLWHTGVGEDLLDNQVMDFLEPWVDRDMVLGPRAWVRPRRRCPYTCVASRPRRPTHRHFVVLPRLASDDDAAPSCDGLTLGRGARSGPVKAKDKNSATGKNSMTRRKQTACTCSSEDSTFRERQASAFTGSRKGCTNVARDNAGCRTSSSSSSTSSSDTGNARCESPWQFSVDMSGCNEVRAMTEGDMLMVEGRGSSDSSHRMMRYITSLPRHVSHDSLTARLNNGRLTVSQKPGIQHLEGQARTLHINMQQQQQQQQKTSENTQLEKTLKSVEHSQAEERQEEHSLLDQTQEERSRGATFS